MPISFHTEDIDFKLSHRLKVKKWIKQVIEMHHGKIKNVNIIFCSDETLYSINKQYLKHEYYTDVITFDHSEAENEIEGDIYISIDRIADNAAKYSNTFENELYRVVIHGVLHLLGFNDKKKSDKKIMVSKEDEALQLILIVL